MKKITIQEGQEGVWGYIATYIKTQTGEVWIIKKHNKTGSVAQIRQISDPFPPEVWNEIGQPIENKDKVLCFAEKESLQGGQR